MPTSLNDPKIQSAIWWAPYLRLLHWEFLLDSVALIPVYPFLLLCAAYYRSISALTVCNPAIPASGWFGESKSDILKELPEEYTPRYILFPRVQQHQEFNEKERLDLLRKLTSDAGISAPFVIKPDKGEKGYGIVMVHDWIKDKDVVVNYLRSMKDFDVVCQAFAPGKELGIFYIRQPDAKKGSVFSVTVKVFPEVVGDGCSSLADLIISNPRFKLQADRFLPRYEALLDWVIPKGERFRLTKLGDHTQGCKFIDGSHLISDELTDQFDKISQQYRGFYYGRYDVRYEGTEDMLKRGKAPLKIVELNGASSSSTNIYDPTMSLWKRYSYILGALKAAYEIGRKNQDKGAKTTSLLEVWNDASAHFENRARYIGSQ